MTSASLKPATLAILCALASGCDRGPAAPSASSAPTGAAAPAASAQSAATPADEVKVEVKIMKENWPSGKPKYWNELRRNAAGKWDKNGIGRAYYDTGALEREGLYKDGVRVGTWKYFNPDGSLLRTEERGDGKAGQ